MRLIIEAIKRVTSIDLDFPFIDNKLVLIPLKDDKNPLIAKICKDSVAPRYCSPKRRVIIVSGNTTINVKIGIFISPIHFETCLLIWVITSRLLSEYSFIITGKNICINNSGAMLNNETIVNATAYIPTLVVSIK